MRLHLRSMKILFNPFPFICYVTAILLLAKDVIYIINYDPFYDPILLWGIVAAISYMALTAIFQKKNKVYLFLFFILENCFRIIFSIIITHCDPKFEVLLISFFCAVYLFRSEHKTHKAIFISSLIVTMITIATTFAFKFLSFAPVKSITRSQNIFIITEVFANLVLTCTQILVTTLSTSLIIRKIHMKSDNTQKELEYISSHDILTGLMNRYRALTFFTNCEARKLNESIEYGIAILDIDDFKTINDTYGHDCGDFALKSYTQELRKKLPIQNKIGRWGGEEFVIIFPKITSETIFELDTIRELLSLTPFYYNGHIIHITATYGMSSSRNWNTAYEVLNDADANLLIGKQNGKNRLVVSQKF